MNFSTPRSAYIHVPFCVHRCGYCNFALIADRRDLVEPYLEALATELTKLAHPREVDTLYFGGGTPTYLSSEQLSRLCETVLRWHPVAENYEWTVEANPGDLDATRVEVLARCGVNRLSLGAQSFQDEKLCRLERDHRREDILQAVDLARSLNLRVSIDLIFAAPDETLAQWNADLEEAIRLGPDHISTYGLTFEQGTTFWNRLERDELKQVSDQTEREMYLLAIDRLSRADFEHYEISNFARSGQRSRHNETYWSGDGYFAAGPGAARYVDGVRETNHRSTTTYLKRVLSGESPVFEREQLDDEQRAREQLIFSLRRLEGIEPQRFQSRTGYAIEQLAGTHITRFVELGLLEQTDSTLRLTQEGLLVSDSLWPDLL